ncbi:hypothetical protein Ddye_008137 [Dipteronia dyeriana]|uniref:RNase H type-1 domain-containing protein n=1 Tax=Dipteronia dyeriana TaxID=168575 RepID=A0AAD9X981_9ROSI|nr:hypothetical protein Ddye_008137 [Dipteronia dyeriana]
MEIVILPFFHSSIKRRQCRSVLSSLSIDGVISVDQTIIKDHIVMFYMDLFSSDSAQIDEDLSIVDYIVPSLVSLEENSLLVAIPSTDAIHDAVFSMDALSAPRPDDFSSRLFQRCWETVGRDVILAVQNFFILKWLPRARVSHFIRDGRLILDYRFRAQLPDLCFRIDRIPISPVTDYLVWPHSRDDIVSCKVAYSRMFHDISQVFAFEVELLAASLAINYAWNLGWHRIWLESGSSYVVQLLSVSHIFREGNQVVYALSKQALGLSSDSWWSFTPLLCYSLFGYDCIVRGSFRFS